MPPSDVLYSVAQIRSTEQAALATLAPGTLMQRAGQAAAEAALRLISMPPGDARILILAGPGNNGGDALEAASRLALAGANISVLLYADVARQPADAQRALNLARNSNIDFLDPLRFAEIASVPWSLVIDGLFGIGLIRPIAGDQRKLIEIVNEFTCPVLAIDVPSGLDADTGNVVGAQGIALHATHTVTFIGNKPGLHTAHGRDYAGEVYVADLGIEECYFPPPVAQLNRIALFAQALVPRRHNSHKGSHGDVAVVGGDSGMAGAVILASRAAAKCGAGRVYAGFVESPPAYDSLQPELMCRLAADLDFSAATLVVGPGLGMSRSAHDLLAQALSSASSMVIDADALNILSTEPGLQQKLAQRKGSTVLTPHPLEAARLLGTSSAAIQADRIAAACELSRRFTATIVLKGSGTIIAEPGGKVVINTTGNPGLATAGTGDVLAGMCGALLAQRWPLWEAVLAAVWLHGHAADSLVDRGTGPVGLTASELIPCIRACLNKLINDHARNRG
jgi:hydroxyethylthiazole kinase-like uncharacterized protein yjeF